MVLVSKYLVPKGYLGLTVFPFVFLKTSKMKENKVLINHENIHLKQQLELFVVPFFLFYGLEFLVRLLQHRNWKMAYRNISFEREAYVHEFDLEYINKRPIWAFLKYLRTNEF